MLDWWHAAVRFEHALQAARGLGAADAHLGAEAVRGLERAKWRLWHGRWPGCRHKLAALCRWVRRTSIRGMAGIARLENHVGELLACLERNHGALVHYAARRRNGEPISTAFVESAVDEIIAKRMNKKQQMRWNRATVLERLVLRFYARVRADKQLSPIFEDAIDDWPAHLEKLSAFWSSVMLGSGRYKGNPIAAHFRQRARLSHSLFERWLALWGETVTEMMPPASAAVLRAKAARVAASLQIALSFKPVVQQPADRVSA